MNAINLDIGKMPPQAVEIEEVVLGALLIEPFAIDEVVTILSPEIFYKEAHMKIYTAILDLYEHNKDVDILTVTEKIKQKNEIEGVGGPFYITQLTSKVAGASHIVEHSLIIRDKFIKRELIRISYEVMNKAYDDSIDEQEILSFQEYELTKLDDYFTNGIQKIHIKDHVMNALKEIDKIQKSLKEGKPFGVNTGSGRLNRLTGGWQPADVVIIAARPSVGKTALSLNFAKKSHVPTVIFTLESKSEKLTMRMIQGDIDEDIKNEEIRDWSKLEHVAKELSKQDIYIEDNYQISTNYIKSTIRKLNRELSRKDKKIELVIIDYLQLMTYGTNRNDTVNNAVADISRKLKGLAKEFDIPFIILSQLNREADGRKPRLSDLRDSGAIEQDADLVIFPWRDKESTENIIELDIAKFRDGALALVELEHNETMTNFFDKQSIPY